MKRLLLWSIIGTGISSIAVQLITIREFLTQFHGNEITISVAIFCWLLFTGLGSLGASGIRRPSVHLYAILLFLVAVWPLPQIILIRIARNIIFVHGASTGFNEILLFVSALILPYCFLVGFVLPYCLKVFHDIKIPFTSGRLYIADSIGDITGGILFSFVLIRWISPFKTIAITSAFLLVISILLSVKIRKRWFFLGAIPAVALFLIFSLSRDFELKTMRGQYGNIVRYMESPYGRIVVSRESPFQYTFWESGIPVVSNEDRIRSEEKVHYTLSQLDQVQNVLLIAGSLGETVHEVLKYSPERIDTIELDPHLTATAKELGFIAESAVLRVQNRDGRRYIEETKNKYDAVLVDMPDPDTFQVNRFFTDEFFKHSKDILTPGGILSFNMSCSPNYISLLNKRKLSVAYNTAGTYFSNVLILPGESCYFLCSDNPLEDDIPARLKLKSINTDYVDGFFYGNVTPERIRHINELIDADEESNRDFKPWMIHLVFQEWFLKHGGNPHLFLIIFFGLVVVYIFFIKREEYVLFSTGLVFMGIEMALLFAFQIIHGTLYLKIGAIVTAFLTGLLPGAIIGVAVKNRIKGLLMGSDAILLGLLSLCLVIISNYNQLIPEMIFLVYSFIFSFFCGLQFPIVTRLIGEKKSPAARCLASDLFGAAVGTALIGMVFIPLWGLQWAVAFMIFVKISSGLVILVIPSSR